MKMHSWGQARYLHHSSLILISTLIPLSSAQSNITSTSRLPTTSPTSRLETSVRVTPPTATSTLASNEDSQYIQHAVFNYYFLIVAGAVVLLGVTLLYMRGRKKRKAGLIRRSTQRALATDVEGFRGRFGRGIVGIPYRSNNRTRSEMEEGLDERGEAPPPYVRGSKPPSIRTAGGIVPVSEGLNQQIPDASRDVFSVELELVTRDLRNEPPSYNERHNHNATQEIRITGDSTSSRNRLEDTSNSDAANSAIHNTSLGPGLH